MPANIITVTQDFLPLPNEQFSPTLEATGKFLTNVTYAAIGSDAHQVGLDFDLLLNDRTTWLGPIRLGYSGADGPIHLGPGAFHRIGLLLPSSLLSVLVRGVRARLAPTPDPAFRLHLQLQALDTDPP